jgi:hypothetical protein
LKSAPPVPPPDGVVVAPPVDEGVVVAGVPAPPVFDGVVVALGVTLEGVPPDADVLGVTVVAVVVVAVLVVAVFAEVVGVPPLGGAVRSGTDLGTL